MMTVSPINTGVEASKLPQIRQMQRNSFLNNLKTNGIRPELEWYRMITFGSFDSIDVHENCEDHQEGCTCLEPHIIDIRN